MWAGHGGFFGRFFRQAADFFGDNCKTFSRAGVAGGVLLLLMFGLWFFAFFGKVFRRDSLAPEVIWGCALVALILFNALWTRPFHRIENTLWLAIAFAVTNREVLKGRLGWRASFSTGFTKLIGVSFVAVALVGLIYLGSSIFVEPARDEPVGDNDEVAQNLN